MKILIADDITENLYLLEFMLKNFGYEVFSAKNGAEALGLAQEDIPDLIISDILMPVMDGFSFCRECKKDTRLNNKPFIFYTSTYTDPKDIDFALSLGADRFIIKPEDPDVFMDTIRALLKEVTEKKDIRVNTKELNETIVLKEYNEALIRKLEDKMRDSEQQEKKLRGYVTELEDTLREHKITEKALQESEERYRLVQESSIDAILLTSPDGAIFSANKAACEMFDMTEEEICLAGRNGLVDLSDSHLPVLIAERAKSGKAKGELTMLKKDKSKFPVEVSTALFTASNGEVRSSMIIRDITSRKMAEEVIRLNEQQLTSIYNSVGDTVFYLDVEPDQQYRFVKVNPAFSKITGIPVSAIIGKTVNEIIPEPSLSLVLRNYQDAITCKSVVRWEETSDYPSGRLTGEVTITPVFDNIGKCDHMVGTVHDITERKQAEAALRESETKYRTLITQSPDGIFIVDLNGNFLSVNQSMCDILKYSETELLSMKIWDIVTEQHHAQLNKRIGEISRGESAFGALEYEIRGQDGVLHQSEVLSAPYYSGTKLIGFQGIGRDITERKLAEEKIRILSSGVEQSPAIIVLTDTTGKILYVNKKFEEVTGYSSAEVIANNPNILKSGTKSQTEYESLWNTILSGNIWTGEFLNKRKNGELYWESASISSIKDEHEIITHFIAIKEDITEKKKMIEDLITAKEKAEEMSRLKSSFLANMSHELRTPLIGIMGFAEILSTSIEDQELVEMADIINKSGKRLSDTLNLILDLSRIEANKINIFTENVNVVDITKTCVSNFSGAALLKNLTLETIIHENNIIARLDERLTIGVLNNLINNAIKYTNNGGVVVETGMEKCEGKPWVYVSIKDTGIGIAEKDYEIIFHEFRQVSEGFGRNFEGVGLGLTISKKITSLMGGTISVKSQLGIGSVFTVRFPISEIVSSGRKVPVKEVPSSEKNGKAEPNVNSFPLLLYVENDEISRLAIKLFLMNVCRLDIAEDGISALQMAREKSYDGFLMDINLGKDMDGIAVTKELRKMPEYVESPIIAITAFAFNGDKEEFLAAGCTDYISKPFGKSQIISLIKKVFGDQS